jgi:hypothetical protein
MEYIRCNKKGSLSNIGVQAAALRLVAFSSGKGVPPFLKEKVALAYMSLNSFKLVDS